MAVPPFNDIDLAALGAYSPPFDDAPLEPEPESAATLSLVVEGAGEIPASGVGVAFVPISASGDGERRSGAFVGISSAGFGYHGSFGHGSTALSLAGAGRGYVDWLANIPQNQLQEVYRLVITGYPDGLDDLEIGAISSWQATNQAGGRESYVQAVIPAADSYMADIEARQNGELVIQKGFKMEDGSTRFEEILRSRFDSLRPDRGRRSLTVTVSGYLPGTAAPSGSRTLTGVRSISTMNGKRRVRCDVDLFLQPKMTVAALGESFRADFINYYVSHADKFCEVGER